MNAPQADTTCPLCHGDNLCEVARGGDIAQCWCREAVIPPHVRLLAPQGKSCICRECASRSAR